MKRLGRWSLVVALILAATGCASSHHAAHRGGSVSLDIQSQSDRAASGKGVSLAYVRGCLERHRWRVGRLSRNEIDSEHGAVVWDIEFKHSRVSSVGWTGDGGSGHEPAVLARCLRGRTG